MYALRNDERAKRQSPRQQTAKVDCGALTQREPKWAKDPSVVVSPNGKLS